MKRIDLNVDIGEGFAFDLDLLTLATSANIACGEHAGSWEITLERIAECQSHGVRVGTHPGYPDRPNMGRKPMEPGQEREFLASIFGQAQRFMGHFRAAYLKPHGAFYNDTATLLPAGWDRPVPKIAATSIPTKYEAEGAFLSRTPGLNSLGMILRIHGLALMGLPGTAHVEIARRCNQTFIAEGFIDRRYRADGTLTPRSEAGAVLHDPAEIRAQVLGLAERVDSLCLHGDTPGAVEMAEMVRKTLVDAGYEVSA